MIIFEEGSLEARLNKVLEECAEVQKEICKLLRFGPLTAHKKYGEVPTILRLSNEVEDLYKALYSLEASEEYNDLVVKGNNLLANG